MSTEYLRNAITLMICMIAAALMLLGAYGYALMMVR